MIEEYNDLLLPVNRLNVLMRLYCFVSFIVKPCSPLQYVDQKGHK